MTEIKQSIATLHDLLDFDTFKLIVGELKLQNSMTEFIKTASSIKLKAALEKYLELIKEHIVKLEQFYLQE